MITRTDPVIPRKDRHDGRSIILIMWKTDVGFLLSFDDLLLAILDVDAVGRDVLYTLAAEIIGGVIS